MKVNSFIKDASILTIGTSIAQFLPMLLYPILGRLYCPEQFAALAAFTSIITILQVVGSGKYEYAILISDSDQEAANIFSLSVFLSLLLMAALYLVLIIFGGQFTYPFSSGLNELIWLTPIGFVLLNIFSCYNEWCVRKLYFKKLSLNKITNSVFVTLGKYSAYYTPLQTIGLTIGDFFGRLITAIVCLVRLFVHDRNAYYSVSVANVKAVALKYKQFPFFTMPAQLLNSMAVAAPVFLLSNYYSLENSGYYSMAMTVLILPVNVISYAVRDVFRKKANDIYRIEGRFDKLYKRVLILFCIISIISCVIIAPFLIRIFCFVLGDIWAESGKISLVLLPMIALDFIAMSLSGVYVVVQKLKSLFVWQVTFFFATIGPLIFGGLLNFSIISTLSLFSIFRGLSYLYMIITMYIFSKGFRDE